MADSSMIYASLEDYTIKIKDLKEELNTLTIGSDKYNSTLKELNATTKELADKTEAAKIATLSFGDNFSDIAAKVTGSASSMTGALGGVAPEISKLGTAWSSLTKLFMANPWVAALTAALAALMAIISKVSDAIKGNEQTSNKWSKAMATFRPIIDGISNAFDWLAKVFVDVVSSITDNIPKIVKNVGAGAKKITDLLGGVIDVLLFIPKTISSALADYMPKIMDVITAPLKGLQKALEWIGADEWAKKLGSAADAAKNSMTSLSKSVSSFYNNAGNYVRSVGDNINRSLSNFASAMETAQKMQERQNELVIRERKLNEELAESEVKIGELRNKIAKETDPKKRIALLKEEQALIRSNGEKQKSLLQDQLKLAKEYAAQRPNSAEDNERLSKMQIAVSKAEAATLNSTQAIEKQVTRATNKIASDAQKAATEAEKAAKKASDAIVKDIQNAEKDIQNREGFAMIDPNREKESLEALGKYTSSEQIKYLSKTHEIQQKFIDERVQLYNNALKNEKLQEDEKVKIQLKIAKLTIDNINNEVKYDNELTKLKIKNIQEVRDEQIKSAKRTGTDDKSQEDAIYAERLATLNEQYEKGEITYKEYLKRLEQENLDHEKIISDIQATENQGRIDALKQYWEDVKSIYGEDSVEALDAYSAYEKAMTDEQLRESNIRIEQNRKEYEQSKRNETEKVKNLKNNIKIATQLSRSIGNIMGSVSEIMEQNIQEKLKRGEISEEEAEKEFENIKKLQIAEAIINTLTGAVQAQMSVWAPGSGITSVWAKIAMSAALGIQTLAAGYAQVEKIKSTTFGGGSTGSVNGGTTIITGAATPLLNEAQDINDLNAMNVATEQGDQRVYILESDLQAADKAHKVRIEESTF